MHCALYVCILQAIWPLTLEVFSFIIFKGIGVTTSSGAVVQARGAILFSSMDLQAKALNVNMHQHNGACGCSTCEATGQHVRSGKGWARHYPYNPNEKERTHQSILENANEALTTGKVKVLNKILIQNSLSHSGNLFAITVHTVQCCLINNGHPRYMYMYNVH